ncbi:MAG: glycerol-3-phosphate dehydrogenase/oxidase [Sphingobacteriales bacterium]|nr:glycerol-3-phosphate dehydrogenase/oxidase [Sphingobacteriales bacterium]
MRRDEMLQQLNEPVEWDVVIIGGGATGLGAAVDAASRGYKTLLLEQHDFAKGTSSRSTKLVHGGVRYLAQGNIKLVKEALKERGILLRNAPHVTSNVSFVMPSYHWWEKYYYGIGLKIYDLLAGKLGLGKTEFLSKKSVIKVLPTINAKGISGGVMYKDGQFDDARLAINLAQTAAEQGATVINYCKVVGLRKGIKKINGLFAQDVLSGKEYELKCKVVINATGVFADDIMQMDDKDRKELVSPSQGVHLVIDKKFFPGEKSLMIPRTDDGRVLFAVPWHDKVVVGTTDTPVEENSLEPVAYEDEIEFIMSHINRYLNVEVKRSDVDTVFVGLRPLVHIKGQKNTALLNRDHTIIVSLSGLVTITGGKWTTYRKMAKDVVTNAAFVAKLPKKECVTDELKIHGFPGINAGARQNAGASHGEHLHYYGSDAEHIKQLWKENPSLKELIADGLPYTKAEIIWAVRNEMAMTAEDVLARRTRLLFLDAKSAYAIAPLVAKLMAEEMNKDVNWITEQIKAFEEVADNYILGE